MNSVWLIGSLFGSGWIAEASGRAPEALGRPKKGLEGPPGGLPEPPGPGKQNLKTHTVGGAAERCPEHHETASEVVGG